MADEQVPRRDGQSVADEKQDRKIDVLENRIQRGELWIIFLTAAMTIAAFAAVYVARKQWRVMEQQTKVMQAQLADARKAAVEGDKVTDRQLKIAEKQADSQKTLADANKDIAAAATKSARATEQLADATRKAADASRSLADSAAQSNVATQRLAAAASDANTVSRELVDTTENISRAFVYAKSVDFEELSMPAYFGPPPVAWQASIQWENTGNTPTRDLIVNSSCWVDFGGAIGAEFGTLLRSDPREFDVCHIEPQDKMLFRNATRALLIGPKQIRNAGGCTFTTIDVLFNQMGLGSYYYVFGAATYHDVFRPQYLHRTEYCFVMTLTGSLGTYGRPETRKPVGNVAVPCREHNCADEECNRQTPLP
jgi:hypothetical protein